MAEWEIFRQVCLPTGPFQHLGQEAPGIHLAGRTLHSGSLSSGGHHHPLGQKDHHPHPGRTCLAGQCISYSIPSQTVKQLLRNFWDLNELTDNASCDGDGFRDGWVGCVGTLTQRRSTRWGRLTTWTHRLLRSLGTAGRQWRWVQARVEAREEQPSTSVWGCYSMPETRGQQEVTKKYLKLPEDSLTIYTAEAFLEFTPAP